MHWLDKLHWALNGIAQFMLSHGDLYVGCIIHLHYLTEIVHSEISLNVCANRFIGQCKKQIKV